MLPQPSPAQLGINNTQMCDLFPCISCNMLLAQLPKNQEGPGPIKTPSQTLLENRRTAGPIAGPGPTSHSRLHPEIPQLLASQHPALPADVREAQVPHKNWICDLETSLSCVKETPLTHPSWPGSQDTHLCRDPTVVSRQAHREAGSKQGQTHLLMIKLPVGFNSCLSMPPKPAYFRTQLLKITDRSI